jgi:hypothetical protein
MAANGFGIPPGPYRIVRLLPLAGACRNTGRRAWSTSTKEHWLKVTFARRWPPPFDPQKRR